MIVENIFPITAIYAENIFSGTESYVTEVVQSAIYVDNYYNTSGINLTVSPAPPANPQVGDLWVQI